MRYRKLLSIVFLIFFAVYISGCTTTSLPAEVGSGDVAVTVRLEGTSYVGREINVTLSHNIESTSKETTNKVSRSNRTGRFLFSDLSAGRYIITVSAPPYYVEQKSEVIVTDQPTSIDLELKVNPKFLSDDLTGTVLFPTRSGYERRDVLEVFALLIAAEAKGEIFPGQVAVGTVIVNRVGDKSFPDNLADVITEKVPPHHQTYQFSPVGDASNFSKSKMSTMEYTIALKAAYQAIAGDDPTGIDPLFFYAYQKVSNSSWIAKKAMASGYVDIGNHRFFH